MASPLAASGRPDPVTTEVYRIDFESGLDAVFVLGPSATLTEDPAEVLEGTRSLKLDGPNAAVALRPDLFPLSPSRVYVVEYRYRALASHAAFALGVGFSLSDGDGRSFYIPLRGPVSPPGTAGVDARSAQAGGANDTFVFHTWGGAAVIDEIRILRHDVRAAAPTPTLVQSGFPRLSNYMLLAPDTTALINGVRQHDVEETAARYDVMMGTPIDHTLGAAAWVRQLRLKNPALRILPYKQAFMAQFEGGIDGSGLTSTFNAGLQPSWFIRTPSGALVSEPAFPQNVQLKHTIYEGTRDGEQVSEYTAGFLAERVLTSGLWDGIHFDQPEWYINPLLGEPPPAMDLDGDGTAEPTPVIHHAWALGFLHYFDTMTKRLGSGTLLFGNAGHIPGNPTVLPLLNGWQGEVVSPYRILPGGEWATDEPSRWYRLLDNYLLAAAHARAPQIVALQFTGRDLGIQTGTVTANGYPQRLPQIEARDYRRMRLGLTTALLGDGFFEYDLVDNTTAPLWFDEFSVDASGVATTSLTGKGYLGQPLGPARELSFASRTVFRLDFETAAAVDGVTPGPGRLSTEPAEVISGASSLVIEQEHAAEGKSLFTGTVPLVPGRTYQLLVDYRILEYRPTAFTGLLGIGFRGPDGGLPPERAASLYLPDTGGPGQQGTLRAAVKAWRSDLQVVGGLTDSGRVAIDDVRLVEGTGGVWRRDFENGIVLVNPTPEPLFVAQADVAGPRTRTRIRRLTGAQAPDVNNGSPVAEGLWLPPGDGIVLLAASLPAAAPSSPGQGMALPSDTAATLVWGPVPEYIAGYIVRYGESTDHLTRVAQAGPRAWLRLDGLTPGTAYVARVTAHDFAGREGPSIDLSFATTGLAPERPLFTLATGSTAVTPGSVVTLEGSALADGAESSSGPGYPLTMAGTTVRVNGIAAPILSAAPNRIALITPWEVTGPHAVISVSRHDVSGTEHRVPVVPAGPWVFTWPGGDIAIATHGDGSLVSAESPAQGGGVVDVLCAGLGAVLPHPQNGQPAAGPHGALVTTPLQVRVNGVAAHVVGAWLLPGTVATYGIRLQVPEGVSSGLQTLEVSAGGAAANGSQIPIR